MAINYLYDTFDSAKFLHFGRFGGLVGIFIFFEIRSALLYNYFSHNHSLQLSSLWPQNIVCYLLSYAQVSVIFGTLQSRARTMNLSVRALTTLVEDAGSVPSTQIASTII